MCGRGYKYNSYVYRQFSFFLFNHFMTLSYSRRFGVKCLKCSNYLPSPPLTRILFPFAVLGIVDLAYAVGSQLVSRSKLCSSFILLFLINLLHHKCEFLNYFCYKGKIYGTIRFYETIKRTNVKNMVKIQTIGRSSTNLEYNV